MDIAEWPIGRKWVNGRAFVDRAPVHVYDLQASTSEFPDGAEMALRDGHRTILAVPLLREDEAIGTLAIRRTEVKPYTEKQIELLYDFRRSGSDRHRERPPVRRGERAHRRFA